jgi:hypothetical protein
MVVPSQLALKTQSNLGFAASFPTLDKLVDKFTLPPAALPVGDPSFTHVIKLAAHSTTSPTPTAMRQSFIMTPYKDSGKWQRTDRSYRGTRPRRDKTEEKKWLFNCWRVLSFWSRRGRLDGVCTIVPTTPWIRDSPRTGSAPTKGRMWTSKRTLC